MTVDEVLDYGTHWQKGVGFPHVSTPVGELMVSDGDRTFDIHKVAQLFFGKDCEVEHEARAAGIATLFSYRINDLCGVGFSPIAAFLSLVEQLAARKQLQN